MQNKAVENIESGVSRLSAARQEVRLPQVHHAIDFAVGTGLHEPCVVGHLIR